MSKMPKERKFTRNELWHEIQDVRDQVYRESNNQRERERNTIRLFTVGGYCLAVGYLLGKPRRTTESEQ